MASPTDNPGQLARILLAHEKARARAWTEKNIQALEVLLAPDFVEINLLGRFSKKEVLVSLVPAVTLHEFIIADPQLVVASPDAAIFTYRCIEDMTARGERITGTFHVAAHYARRDNKWLLLVWQITPFTS
ncbi:MAG TPA: nuclear transport factor 2 family protein [Methanoregulaceae archaeon]|nr:nuclear transport factor 2 family protein [Methanoregulaceae archaeon]